MRDISPQELLTLINQGADVQLPEMPKEATQVEGMEHIARHLHHLAQAQTLLAENQSKMIESIDRLTKVLANNKINIKPLIAALTMNASCNKQKDNYHFEVERLQNGRISGITAKVVEH